MAGMKVSLHGMFANIKRAMRTGDRNDAALYAFSLDELERHLKETVRGEHSLEELAECYCLKDKADG